MLPPPKDGVKYVVSWQEHENASLPDSIRNREDVEVYRYEEKGLSNNRNNAIEHCRGDVVLISDDDLVYHPDFACRILNTFKNNPDLDLGVFKINFLRPKSYPVKKCKLRLPLPKNYYCSSVEIAFRREKVSRLKFWNKIGLGNTELVCGEDELFLIAALKHNYNCFFINEEIASHLTESTGDKLNDGILRGQGFIMGVIYPYSSLIRLPLKAYRTSKTKESPFFHILWQLIRGNIKSYFYKKSIPAECL